jgi:hypothetical protein
MAFSFSRSRKTTTLGLQKRFSEAGSQICKNSEYKYIYIWNKLKMPPFVEEPNAYLWSSPERAIEEARTTQTETETWWNARIFLKVIPSLGLCSPPPHPPLWVRSQKKEIIITYSKGTMKLPLKADEWSFPWIRTNNGYGWRDGWNY